MFSLANGGPHPFRAAVMSVDYKGRERSNHMKQEFHHIIGTPFFFLNHPKF